jgi:hypothetical protein
MLLMFWMTRVFHDPSVGVKFDHKAPSVSRSYNLPLCFFSRATISKRAASLGITNGIGNLGTLSALNYLPRFKN